MKYRKKPVVIEAIKWTGENLDELRAFVPEEFRNNKIHQPLGLITLEGVLTISEGDYVIRGVKGEFYPCKPDIFEMTHEKVESIQERAHIEDQSCWCGPALIQAIDDEHDAEVWSHKGHEELDN